MKKLAYLCVLIIGLGACGPTYQSPPVVTAPPYEYIQSPQGQQMVVVRDNDGMEFLMQYALFTSLMNSGGYNTVINHYHSHPGTYGRYNRTTYSNWRPFNGRSYNSSYYGSYNKSSGFRSSGNSSPVFKNTTPSTRNSSSPSFINTTRSSNSSPGFRSTSPKGSSWSSSSGSSGFRSSGSSGSSFKSSSGSSGFRSSSSSSYRSSSSSSSGFRSSRKN